MIYLHLSIFAVTTTAGFILGYLFPTIHMGIPLVLGGSIAYVMYTANRRAHAKEMLIVIDAHKARMQKLINSDRKGEES